MTAPIDHVFLAACRGEPTAHPPVWFMRQAGRSLPEYRAIRGEGSILDGHRQPRAGGRDHPAAGAALRRRRRHPLLRHRRARGRHRLRRGRRSRHRARSSPSPSARAADLDRLRPLDPEADTPYVLETVRILAKELTVPLIGFAGAPFTVASYLVEGGPTRTWAATKRLMFGDPGLWDALLDRLADLAIASLRSQVVAGAQAVQLFDSWAGQLHPADYRRYVLPHSAKVLAGVADLGVPRIHFGVGTGELLAAMAEAGADVVGVDWRVPLDEARRRLGTHAGPGQPRPGRRAVRRGTSWPSAGRQGAPRRGDRRAGTHLQPRPRGDARDRSGHPRTARRPRPRLVARDQPHCRRAHGLRHPTPCRTRSRRTTPTSGGAALPRPSSSPSWWPGTTPSAASRRSPSAPKPSAPACSRRSTPELRRPTRWCSA